VAPKISVCRKRDHVYLKLMGNCNPTSAYEILHAVERVVTASLKFASPGSKVFYTFRAHAKVRLGKKEAATGLDPPEDTILPAVEKARRRKEGLLHNFSLLI
jgi:hypothetical protein